MMDEYIQPFSIPSSDEMPSKANIRKAIEDAVEAKKMKKSDRLVTYSFATRYGKKTRLENKNAKSTCTQSETSKELYTAGDLVWVERTGQPSWPGMVETDPAQMKYCRSFEADADKMSMGEMKKAIEDAEEAAKMSNEDRLTKYGYSVRNDKKGYQDKNKESENQVGRTGDQKLPGRGQHDCASSTSAPLKKKRISKHNLEAAKKKVVKTGDQRLHGHSSNGKGQRSICSRKATQNSFRHSERPLTEGNKEGRNEMEVIVIDQDSNDHPDDGENIPSPKTDRVDVVESLDGQRLVRDLIVASSDDDEVYTYEHISYAKYLQTLFRIVNFDDFKGMNFETS